MFSKPITNTFQYLVFARLLATLANLETSLKGWVVMLELACLANNSLTYFHSDDRMVHSASLADIFANVWLTVHRMPYVRTVMKNAGYFAEQVQCNVCI